MAAAKELYERIWQEQSSLAPYKGGNLRVDLVAGLLPGGKRMLDLGCGDGVLGELVKDRFEEVVGADISELALAIARRRGLKACKVNVDEEPLPFPDGHFECITCLDLIEHVFEPRTLVREMARVLALNGALFVAFPNMRYILRIKELVAGRFPKTSGDLQYAYDGGHLHYYTPEDVRRLLEEQCLAVTGEWGIVSPGIRDNYKYRLLRLLLPPGLRREFLSIEVVLGATRSQ